MLIHLIKKDVLLVGKFITIIMLAVVIAFPFFMLWRSPDFAFLGYMISAVFSVFMGLQIILMKEDKYKKTSAYLCSTPYPRDYTVISKYILCFVVFAISSLIYFVETLIVPKLGNFDFTLLILTFSVIVFICGLFLPLNYKFGFAKTKYFFSIIIVAIPFATATLIGKIGNYENNFLQTNVWFIWVLLLISILLYGLSAFISILIYRKTEL